MSSQRKRNYRNNRFIDKLDSGFGFKLNYVFCLCITQTESL